ncbi:uncharacterized protein LOC125498539 [Beta vulgaris subsp. vulgaris]|uniref:uncharacterized protein LOC125498539 n=1 Tax=Beta vulgaris subsp. vulgaris TaxID=3555 RepID=UPI002036999A|nr:uncharacterized protein LOC125498539 [Beta vulgaris subsp. vulgaris]
MSKEKISLSDIKSPLYLHPSDGPNIVCIEKLQGMTNYRTWQRSMEISLAAKRKLGFVTGTVVRDGEDAVKQEQWDTCDSLVISWLHGSMTEAVKRYVLYLNTSRAIWVQLKARFQVAHGARKYKLSRELYDVKHNGATVNEYYTNMKALWEELESLNSLPPITTMTTEINEFVAALNKQQEEQHLFQFLIGLDEEYGAQRSQLLMKSPLPSVEEACSSVQQEEAHREILNISKLNLKPSAMFNKTTNESGCTECGGKGHSSEKCWYVVGLPKNHPKHRQQMRREGKEGIEQNAGNRWNRFKGQGTRMAANAELSTQHGEKLLTF